MSALSRVGRQMSQLQRDLKKAINEINAQAARKVAQGNYLASQELMALAKTVHQFAIETKDLNKRCMRLVRGRRKNHEPILRRCGNTILSLLVQSQV